MEQSSTSQPVSPDAADACQSNPCLNSGHCAPGGSGYTCNCTNTGYRGVSCEVGTCALSPCGDGVCLDETDGYRCDCNGTGASGDNCASNETAAANTGDDDDAATWLGINRLYFLAIVPVVALLSVVGCKCLQMRRRRRLRGLNQNASGGGDAEAATASTVSAAASAASAASAVSAAASEVSQVSVQSQDAGDDSKTAADKK